MEVGSNMSSTMEDDQNVYPAAETRMAGKKNHKIGRRKVFESEDESLNLSAMGKTDMIKGSNSKLKSSQKNHSNREKTESQNRNPIRNGGRNDRKSFRYQTKKHPT